jgi:hypothetical protein
VCSSDLTGTVTLVVAATSDDRITIVGSRPIERSTDFTTGGDFFANTLNVELDSQTILVQQVAETAERAIKAPVTDPTNIDMTLPINTDRAGTFLGFDEDGNPIPGPAIASVGTITGNIANINTVANNITNVNTTATNIANVNTVAGISGNVTTVAGISGNVTSVAGNDTNINTVATNIANVNATGSNIANVNAVAGNETNINAVNANKTNIDTVASVSGSVTTVAGISGNVTKVADVDADVTTVAGISGNVATVAGISGNVTTVAGNTTNINTVATNDSNITTVAGINADVSTVATNSANVTAVAANATNINTVAANNTNVTTVATNIASVNTNTANITAIQNASSNAINVANALTQVNSGQKDIFEDGTDFTTSVTDELTLSQTPAKANFVHVFFDTDYQASDTYTIVGNVITFDSAIVATKVEIVYDVAKTLIEDALWNLADKRARASFAREKNTPVIPTLLLDFEGDKELDPRVTFARASTARYYDGKTVAKAEENLLFQSQTFDNAGWLKIRSTVTADTTAAPDGTTTADSLLQEVGQTTQGLIRQNFNSDTKTYTASVFAKPNGKDFIYLVLVDSDAILRGCFFDVNNGTVGTALGGAVGTITASTNGFYRCSIVLSFAAGGASSMRIFLADSDNNTTVVDDGTGLFIWGAQVEQRSAVTAYTPTTTQPITNYIPVLLSAANNEARFDHNPTTSESLGLLIEEQRTNLVTYSEQFDNASWGKERSSVFANTTIAPDGTLTADTLVEDTTAGQHAARKLSVTVPNDVPLSFSVYVKRAVGGRNVGLRFEGISSEIYAAAFDLTLGSVIIVSSGATASIVGISNGWYRVSLTVPADDDATIGQLKINMRDGSDVVYTGDGTSELFIWGAQLEAGAFPTSYIPTVASQVTRSADAASMTGTNFSSWYRQDEGTMYADAVIGRDLSSVRYFTISDSQANDNNVIQIVAANSAGTLGPFVFVTVNAVAQTTIGFATPTANTRYISSLAYKVNDFAFTTNGATTLTDTLGIIPVVDRCAFGSSPTVGQQLNGTIRKIAFYPKRLTNEQLQAITT